MATGADLLAAMGDLNDELAPTSGGADSTRALRALNRAQDLLELDIAQIPNVFGTSTTVTTTASTETTAVPSGYLRFDRLQFLDASTSLPVYNLERVDPVGDVSVGWSGLPTLFASATATSSRPYAYSIYGDNIYWSPLPDATHTIRVYGFAVASDITNGGTFAYGDQFIWPVAAVAVRMFKQRLDDPQDEINAFARETFGSVLKQLKSRVNDGALYPRYGNVYTV